MHLKQYSVLLVCLLLFTGCVAHPQSDSPTSKSVHKLKVVTSIYPLQEFVQTVGGDKVEVIGMVPPGTEPHDWEPTPKDMQLLQTARVFIYNGAGMEHWVEKVLANLPARDDFIVTDTSTGINGVIASPEQTQKPHDNVQTLDPHFWLDPLLAQQQVSLITTVLCQADPDNRDYYNANAMNYIQQLQDLHEQYAQTLAKAKQKDFVTTHTAFAYMAQRYHLHQIPIMGIEPDAEPAPADMARLIDEVKQRQLKYVFFETMVSPKVAQTIANAAGADTLVLDPIENLSNEQVAQGDTYLTVMQRNLDNLKLALEAE